MLQSICIFALTGAIMAYTIQTAAGPLGKGESQMTSTETIALPAPKTKGTTSLEEALQKRRSTRSFLQAPLALADVSQLLWAAQGITDTEGLRAAPSAGALYPLELYILAGNVRDLPAGIYHYVPIQHRLETIRAGQFRADIAAATLHQGWLEESAAIFLITAIESRTIAKYGTRATRYIHMEAGHAAQNALLQAVALGLGGTPVGAFNDEQIAKILALPREQKVLYLLPIGKTH